MRKLIVTLTAVFVFILNATAQDRTISGTVTNDKGKPVEGVSVVSNDGKQGTQTDKEGKFSLTVPKTAKSLVFSFVNFESQTKAIGNLTAISVSLKTRDASMDEVVVVGYGTQVRRKATGSSSKIETQNFKDLLTSSVDRQLAGRATGVQVTVAGGSINTPARIRIRGVNSVSLGRDPLYIVDGVPVITGNNAAVTNSNSLGDFNPNDIENIEVLKDGSATAIYGSRAANGVVMITTKKGKSGRTRINYDVSLGFNSVAKRFDLLNAQEFVTIANEKLNNAGGVNQAFMRPDNASTDWQSQIFVKNAFVQNHTLSFSGGSDKTTFYTSLNYSQQDGTIRTNFNRRYGATLNFESEINKYVKFGNSLTVSRQEDGDQQNGGNALSGAIAAAIRDLPNVVPYSSTHATGYNLLPGGNALGRDANTRTIENNYVNIAFVLDKNKFLSDKYRILMKPYLEISPLKWLKFRSQASVDYQLIYDFLSYDPRHGDGFSSVGVVQNTFTQNDLLAWQNYINITKSFGRHNVYVTVGNEMQRNRNKFIVAQGTNIADLYFQQSNIIGNTYAIQSSGGGYSQSGFHSYFGRVNYDYDGKYFVQFSIRRDATSALSPETRIGNFPGASIGWRLGQEKFWQKSIFSKIVNDIKLRASFAVVGNVAGGFPYLTTYAAAPYASTGGIALNAVGNPNLKWETNKKYDVGADFSLFNNRITVIADWFRNINDDLIFFVPTPNSYGLPGNGTFQNIGSSKNEGFEIGVNTMVAQCKDFKWSMYANFTSINNKITKLYKGQEIPLAGGNNGTFNVLREGEPINSLYGYAYAGVNAANGNPMWYKADGSMVQLNIADQNYYYALSKNDPNLGLQTTLSTSDRKVMGPTTPTWFGSFTNTFEYKNFVLDIMFRYSGGNMVYNLTRQESLLSQGFTNNGREILDRWTKPGQVTTVPKVWYGRDNSINLNGRANSRFVEKGDYLRLQNLSLSYTFNNKFLDDRTKGLIKSCRFFVQGQNLYTWTKYKGIDPDNINELGIDNNVSPTIRSISFGFNFGL